MIGRIKKVGGRGRVRQEEERRGKGSLSSEDTKEWVVEERTRMERE